MRLSLRPIFLQPGRSLTRLSCQHLGAVLEDVPVQSFISKAGATFRLKDGALAYARVRRCFRFSGLLSLERLWGHVGPFLFSTSLVLVPIFEYPQVWQTLQKD